MAWLILPSATNVSASRSDLALLKAICRLRVLALTDAAATVALAPGQVNEAGPPNTRKMPCKTPVASRSFSAMLTARRSDRSIAIRGGGGARPSRHKSRLWRVGPHVICRPASPQPLRENEVQSRVHSYIEA